jgi:hypothetical protein
MDDPHQPVGPGDQLFGMARRSRQQAVEVLRGADQAVFAALGRRQHLVEQAFAHAEGREHDGLGPGDPDHIFEHQRGVGEQRSPRIGNHLDIGETVGRGQAPQALRKIERVRRR